MMTMPWVLEIPSAWTAVCSHLVIEEDNPTPYSNDSGYPHFPSFDFEFTWLKFDKSNQLYISINRNKW
jgi:hypothetical protein